MRYQSVYAVLVPIVFALFTACQMRPPVELTSSLRVSPDLELMRPVDIGVLPVEDATADRAFEPWCDVLRQSVAGALMRYYTPLNNVMVDKTLSGQGEVRGVSPVDAAWVGRIAGSFDEDALLGLRILEWDDSRIMQDQRARFSIDVLMIASDGQKLLWSGRLDGNVKAGGEGPSPLGRNARTRSAVEELAVALIGELPSRRG